MPRLCFDYSVCKLAATALTLLFVVNVATAEEFAIQDSDGQPWTITIAPAVVTDHRPAASSEEFAAAQAADARDPSSTGNAETDEKVSSRSALKIQPAEPRSRGTELAAEYRRIYRQIPFSRSLYNANPQYRHELALQLLFGEMQPQVVHRHQSAPAVQPEPAPTPYRPYLPARWDYWRVRGSYFPYLFVPGF